VECVCVCGWRALGVQIVASCRGCRRSIAHVRRWGSFYIFSCPSLQCETDDHPHPGWLAPPSLAPSPQEANNLCALTFVCRSDCRSHFLCAAGVFCACAAPGDQPRWEHERRGSPQSAATSAPSTITQIIPASETPAPRDIGNLFCRTVPELLFFATCLCARVQGLAARWARLRSCPKLRRR
jgi:hypothetical protein